MSDKTPPSSGTTGPQETKADYYVLRLRRCSLAEWSAWVIWLIALGILVEYAMTSMAENERQAGILAGIIALGLLFAGIIVEAMKRSELRRKHEDMQFLAGDDDTPET